jgi:hypothetical protein
MDRGFRSRRDQIICVSHTPVIERGSTSAVMQQIALAATDLEYLAISGIKSYVRYADSGALGTARLGFGLYIGTLRLARLPNN